MKLKKRLGVFLLVFLLVFTVSGCAGGESSALESLKVTSSADLSKPEIKKLSKQNSNLDVNALAKKIESQVNTVKSAEVNYNVQSFAAGKKSSEFTTKAKTLYDDKKGGATAIYNSTQIADNTVFSYADITANRAWIDEGDGKGFNEVTLSKKSGMEISTDSDYKTTIKMMLLAKDMMVLSEDEDYYYLKFAGKNGELFYKIDGLFNLGIDLNHLGDVDIDVSYKIRKADFMLTEVIHNSKEHYGNIDYNFKGTMNLESYNNFDDIKEAKGINTSKSSQKPSDANNSTDKKTDTASAKN